MQECLGMFRQSLQLNSATHMTTDLHHPTSSYTNKPSSKGLTWWETRRKPAAVRRPGSFPTLTRFSDAALQLLELFHHFLYLRAKWHRKRQHVKRGNNSMRPQTRCGYCMVCLAYWELLSLMHWPGSARSGNMSSITQPSKDKQTIYGFSWMLILVLYVLSFVFLCINTWWDFVCDEMLPQLVMCNSRSQFQRRMSRLEASGSASHFLPLKPVALSASFFARILLPCQLMSIVSTCLNMSQLHSSFPLSIALVQSYPQNISWCLMMSHDVSCHQKLRAPSGQGRRFGLGDRLHSAWVPETSPWPGVVYRVYWV